MTHFPNSGESFTKTRFLRYRREPECFHRIQQLLIPLDLSRTTTSIYLYLVNHFLTLPSEPRVTHVLLSINLPSDFVFLFVRIIKTLLPSLQHHPRLRRLLCILDWSSITIKTSSLHSLFLYKWLIFFWSYRAAFNLSYSDNPHWLVLKADHYVICSLTLTFLT